MPRPFTKQQRETDDDYQEEAASPRKGLRQHFRGPRLTKCRGTPAQSRPRSAAQTPYCRTRADPDGSRQADRNEAARFIQAAQGRFQAGFSRKADADVDGL